MTMSRSVIDGMRVSRCVTGLLIRLAAMLPIGCGQGIIAENPTDQFTPTGQIVTTALPLLTSRLKTLEP